MSNPYGQFFWNDYWADTALALTSLAAQGLWMRMLCLMGRSDETGYLRVGGRPIGAQELAALCGKPADEVTHLLDELERSGVFSRNKAGTIFNRRMVRDALKSEARRNAANQRWSARKSVCLTEPEKEMPENRRRIGGESEENLTRIEGRIEEGIDAQNDKKNQELPSFAYAKPHANEMQMPMQPLVVPLPVPEKEKITTTPYPSSERPAEAPDPAFAEPSSAPPRPGRARAPSTPSHPLSGPDWDVTWLPGGGREVWNLKRVGVGGDVVPRATNGEPTINDWLFSESASEILAAADVWDGDPLPPDTVRTVQDWLTDALEPDAIIAAIKAALGQEPRPQWRSLRFFDQVVRRLCKPVVQRSAGTVVPLRKPQKA